MIRLVGHGHMSANGFRKSIRRLGDVDWSVLLESVAELESIEDEEALIWWTSSLLLKSSLVL